MGFAFIITEVLRAQTFLMTKFRDPFGLRLPVVYAHPLRNTCHYVVNHYVKKLHVLLGVQII